MEEKKIFVKITFYLSLILKIKKFYYDLFFHHCAFFFND